MEQAELLPCPFCGGPAVLETHFPSHTRNAWAYVKCKNRCVVAPQVGESCGVGYWDDSYVFVRYHTDEEAQQIANDRAAKYWNRRA